MVPGIYEVTAYAKATTPAGNDIYFRAFETNLAGSEVDTTTQFDLTTSYTPVSAIVRWPANGTRALLGWWEQNLNGLFISHITVEYLGPLTPQVHDIKLVNAEEGDADGDRAASIK
jgi:hypothetical protein